MDNSKLNKLRKDLGTICDYLYEEEKHYEENDKPLNHIWRYIKRVKHWLKDSDKHSRN